MVNGHEVIKVSNTPLFKKIFFMNVIKSLTGISIEVPQCPIKVKEDVFVVFKLHLKKDEE